MPNEENLKKGEPFRFRSGEEAAKAGQKGGIASGESRRRKKAMRDTAKMILDESFQIFLWIFSDIYIYI